MSARCCERRFRPVDAGRASVEAEDELVPGIPNPMAAVQAVMADFMEQCEARAAYACIEWRPAGRRAA